MADQTDSLGLHTRGPLATEREDSDTVWDFDANMRRIDSSYRVLADGLAALGGFAGGVIDLGTF